MRILRRGNPEDRRKRRRGRSRRGKRKGNILPIISQRRKLPRPAQKKTRAHELITKEETLEPHAAGEGKRVLKEVRGGSYLILSKGDKEDPRDLEVNTKSTEGGKKMGKGKKTT